MDTDSFVKALVLLLALVPALQSAWAYSKFVPEQVKISTEKE